MPDFIWKWLNWRPDRDNNYYLGLSLLIISILTIVVYLIFDLFEPLSFLITFLICGWGFVLLWKSDQELRFEESPSQTSGIRGRNCIFKKVNLTCYRQVF